MNPHYSAFIELGKTLVREKGLSWDMPLDETGAARDGVGWNLTVSCRRRATADPLPARPRA